MVGSALMNLRGMRAHVIKLVRKVLREKNIAPGATWREVVEKLGLPPVQFCPMALDQDGYRDGRQIVINRFVTCDERREFTIFHEIVHIIIEEDGEIDSSLLEFVENDSQNYRWHLENLCNLGAAEFVMPSEAFKCVMDSYEWQIARVDGAQGAFRCSLLAAAFHFTHHNPDPCSLVICEFRHAPAAQMNTVPTAAQPALGISAGSVTNSSCNGRDWIVAYTACNEEGYAMQRFRVVPQKHLIRDVAWRKQPIEAMAEPLLKSKKALGPMRCHAAYFNGRVYAVFYRRERQWQTKRFQGSMEEALFGA